jgi:hypothetical protein
MERFITFDRRLPRNPGPGRESKEDIECEDGRCLRCRDWVDEQGSETFTRKRARPAALWLRMTARTAPTRVLALHFGVPFCVSSLQETLVECRGSGPLSVSHCGARGQASSCMHGQIFTLQQGARRQPRSRLPGSRRDAFMARSNQTFVFSLSGGYSEALFYAG